MDLQTIYGDWRSYNDLVVDALRAMSAEELSLQASRSDPTSSTGWPIWAIAGHTAGARVFWLSAVLNVPGRDETPFGDASSGWEDDLDNPRTAEELVTGWTTTWAIVERALDLWRPDMLEIPVAIGQGETARHLTRRSVLFRLVTHEAYHLGEIALIQAIHGRPPIDLWPPNYHTTEAAATRDARRLRRSKPTQDGI